ncbi:MAG: hypothetical protein SGJ11_09885 [Phycisphaerae bacterium]|nr:hypothetical protein [Phycisphaerae bacterium]
MRPIRRILLQLSGVSTLALAINAVPAASAAQSAASPPPPPPPHASGEQRPPQRGEQAEMRRPRDDRAPRDSAQDHANNASGQLPEGLRDELLAFVRGQLQSGKSPDEVRSALRDSLPPRLQERFDASGQANARENRRDAGPKAKGPDDKGPDDAPQRRGAKAHPKARDRAEAGQRRGELHRKSGKAQRDSAKAPQRGPAHREGRGGAMHHRAAPPQQDRRADRFNQRGPGAFKGPMPGSPRHPGMNHDRGPGPRHEGHHGPQRRMPDRGPDRNPKRR